MASLEQHEERVGALLRKVDELATRALANSEGPEAAPAMLKLLSEIASQAESAHLAKVQEVARELSRELESKSGCGEDALLAGIHRLQNTLEHDSKQPFEAPAPETSNAVANPVAADPELIGEFIVESTDHLTSIEAQLLTLEQDPANKDAIHSVFRSFHTIKGLCGFLELPEMQSVAHEVETLLDKARNGQLSITPSVVDVILEGADYLKVDVARVGRELNGAAHTTPATNKALIIRIQAQMSGNPPAAVAAESAAPEEEAKEAAPKSSGAETKAEASKAGSESRVVKIDTSKLDALVDMVGELVIAQSMVRHDGHLSSTANATVQRNLSQLERITADVQKTTMSMRMVPVGQLFQRSVRLVRDLTRKAGKKAELDLVGEETELDRILVEELADPLMHMIRNSADHGIETPEQRVAAGKPAAGKICLKAYHQSGHVVIEVGDDGRGLDRQKILKKARERGLVQDGSQMTDKEVYNLIFEPGFSTAEKITDISGRGVGMDVVRKQIQKMRGRVDIESRLGQGTTFFLKVPLTLAIIDGLLVGLGKERYIVPIYVVKEMFRPTAEQVFTVEGRREMILVRGTLLPVVRLHERFGVEPRSTKISDCVLVVAESGERRFCVMVDELLGKQEVVIKSLGDTFKNVAGVAGGAILGDGRVGIILDVDSLVMEPSHA